MYKEVVQNRYRPKIGKTGFVPSFAVPLSVLGSACVAQIVFYWLSGSLTY